MFLADTLGFLFTQKELVAKPANLRIDDNLRLDLVHCTAVPLVARFFSVKAIRAEVFWLRHTLDVQKEYEYNIRVITKSEELGNIGMKVVLGLQHPPYPQPTADELAELRSVGVVFMTLAYDKENVYGGGFQAPDAPLTEAGKKLLGDMARVGMVLDVSHVGRRTIRDAIAYADQNGLCLPIVATHSGCADVHSHPRNLPDDIIESIVAHHGFIGIPAATFMVGKTDNSIHPLRPMWRHIRHAVDIVGSACVAVGGDGVYKHLTRVEQEDLFRMMRALVDADDTFGVRFPVEPEALNTGRRMEIIADNLRGVLQQSAIRNVCGETFKKFLVAHL